MVASDIVPNFFVVGAPKCGTTALCEYLRGHRNVFMSYPKEPHFFADDFSHFHVASTLDDYMNLFRSRTEDHLAVGEGSVWYLYSNTALRNIYQFNPSARIIVIVRNPVDVVHSLHSANLFSFAEDRTDIVDAWHAQAERKQGRSIPRKCVAPRFLRYREIAEFGAQLERLYAIFPDKQIKCLVFDDLRDNPGRVYADVLRFLDLTPDGRDAFPIVNENRIHRSRWLGSFMMRPPGPIQAAWRHSRKVLGFESSRLVDRLVRMNSARASRAPLDNEFRCELAAEFDTDVRRLSSCIGRDLTHWTRSSRRESGL